MLLYDVNVMIAHPKKKSNSFL